MLQELSDASRRVVGQKRVLRALAAGEVTTAFVAKDADKFLVKPIEDFCLDNNVPCRAVETMAELGKACGIDVGAAAAAVRRA